jgi:predicted Zn finger-like uncharacterized protein
MPIVIRCPECQRRLRVPDDLLGKAVKCPTCKATFQAAAEDEAGSPPAPRREEAPRGRARPPEEDYEARPSPAVRRRRREEEDEFADDEDDDYEDRPRRRRGRRRAEARSAVLVPAIGLMVTGGLGIAVAVLDFVLRVLNVGIMATGGPGAPANKDPAYRAGYQAGIVLGGGVDLLALILYVILIVGAIRMCTLQNRGLGMAACIIGIIPCWCCILGLPFGIWGLVVLNREDVSRAFS